MAFDAKTDTAATALAASDKFPFGDVSADGWDTIAAENLLAAILNVGPTGPATGGYTAGDTVPHFYRETVQQNYFTLPTGHRSGAPWVFGTNTSTFGGPSTEYDPTFIIGFNMKPSGNKLISTGGITGGRAQWMMFEHDYYQTPGTTSNRLDEWHYDIEGDDGVFRRVFMHYHFPASGACASGWTGSIGVYADGLIFSGKVLRLSSNGITLPSHGGITGRNWADSADIGVLSQDSSNRLQFANTGADCVFNSKIGPANDQTLGSWLADGTTFVPLFKVRGSNNATELGDPARQLNCITQFAASVTTAGAGAHSLTYTATIAGGSFSGLVFDGTYTPSAGSGGVVHEYHRLYLDGNKPSTAIGLQVEVWGRNGGTVSSAEAQRTINVVRSNTTITTLYGHRVQDTFIDTGGAVGTYRALYVDDLSSATTNVALRTGLGETRLCEHASAKFGIFTTSPVVKQTVTGSRGGNAALASFLTAMAAYGWIIDSTSA